jgi:glycosyltransferase involved in cell wall biosynthesis
VPSSVTHGGSLALGICTFNRGGAFTPTLESLARLDRAQGRLARFVIVNNASTDDTAEVVRAFAAANPALPIELIDEPTPGKLHAMRRLFAATHETFVAIIDDDTVPDPAWAVRLLALMDEHPECGVAGGPVINHWETGPTKLARIYRRSLGDFELGPERVRLDRPDSFLLGASLLCRREAVEASGWLNASKLIARTGTNLQSGAEDAELCIRVRQTPCPVHGPAGVTDRKPWEIWYEPHATMRHLIPARRQTPKYLARLRGDVERSMPSIAWIAGLVPAREHAETQLARAKRRSLKTLLFDWRPRRRRVRLAERRGRIEGWEIVLRRMAQEPGPANGV